MKQFLITGNHADGSGELFSCDWFVEAEDAKPAYDAWVNYLAEEWNIDLKDVEGIRVFEVPAMSTRSGNVRILEWHSEVEQCVV